MEFSTYGALDASPAGDSGATEGPAATGGVPEIVRVTEAHGEARIDRIAGHVAAVRGALNPDGTRDAFLHRGRPGSGQWRRRKPCGAYVAGTLEITDGDVWFIDLSPQDAAARPLREDALAAHLCGNAALAEALADDGLAMEFYEALAGGEWVNEDLGRRHLGRWDHAAETVCRLRGVGEIPCDWFMSGGEGFVSVRARALFAGIGWKPTPPAHGAAARRMSAALRLVEAAEKERAAPVPAWYVHWINGLREGGELDARAHRAAFSGRMTFGQWIRFWELFGHGEDEDEDY